MSHTTNLRRDEQATAQPYPYDVELAEMLLRHAQILRKRIANSRRVHPELADPQVLAFWLEAFQDVADKWATEQEERAAQLLRRFDSG